MSTNEVKIGSVAEVKVGRNAIPAVIMEILPDGFKVRSTATNREFKVSKVERVLSEPKNSDALKAAGKVEMKQPVEPEAPARLPMPRTEGSDGTQKQPRGRSLLEAAIEVLKTSGKPMNTRELVEAATEAGLWTPTACKTPEQTLYGSIFREIAGKEHPRVHKSGEKGKFEFAG